MASLDYVIMSEFARVDLSGLVTIVGGSFDRVQATQRGAGQQLFITLRAILEEAETSVSFEVKVRPPTGQFEIGITGEAARRPEVLPIDGRVGVIAAVGLVVPLQTEGRHEVRVSVGQETRVLPFVVEFVQPAGA
ncbi:MAG: hypothetical protein ACRDQU_12415 [Pseudonocardiaceae bacterium]